MALPMFRLDPDLDLANYAAKYARDGRVRIERLPVEEHAKELYHFLDGHDQWWQLIYDPEGAIELDRSARARMGRVRRERYHG